MAELNFDASRVAPDTGTPDPVPADWYNVTITGSEIKPTNDGSGAYLECTSVILDGQYAGRKLWSRFNIRNANPVAQEIAYKQLSAVAHAVGVLQVQDSAQLHNIPMKVKVKVVPATAQYDAKNEITAYRNINQQVDTKAGAPAAPAAPAYAPPAAPAAPAPGGWGAPPAAAPAAPPAGGWAPPANAQQPWQAPQQPQQPQYQPPQAPVQQPQYQQPQQFQQPAQQPAWAAQDPNQQFQQPQQQFQQQPPQQQQHPAQSAPPPWAGQPGQ